MRLFSFGGYGLALAALALLVFGAYDSYPIFCLSGLALTLHLVHKNKISALTSQYPLWSEKICSKELRASSKKNPEKNDRESGFRVPTKWLFTRCPIQNVLGWFLCVQVNSHLNCVRFVSVRSSLPCTNIGVRIELTFLPKYSYNISRSTQEHIGNDTIKQLSDHCLYYAHFTTSSIAAILRLLPHLSRYYESPYKVAIARNFKSWLRRLLRKDFYVIITRRTKISLWISEIDFECKWTHSHHTAILWFRL